MQVAWRKLPTCRIVCRPGYSPRMRPHRNECRLASKQRCLTYVQLQLKRLGIDSRIGQYNQPERRVSLIRGKPVVFESRTFWLTITKLNSMKRFAHDIGFTIRRKQQKLRDALNLINRVGSRRAGAEWLRIYTKEGTRWARRHDQRQISKAEIAKAHGPVVQLVKMPPSH